MKKVLFIILMVCISFSCNNSASAKKTALEKQSEFAIIIHGGAGTILRGNLSKKKEKAYRDKLEEAIRAGYTILKNGGTSQLASHFADRLSNGPELQGVPIYGGTGVGDVAQLPFLILDLLRGFGGEGDIRLTTGEALPLIAQSSIVAAHSALAIYDTEILLEELTANAALDLEAYSANPSPYSEMVGTVRPYAGYQKALRKIRNYLHGGQIRARLRRAN